MAEGGWVSVGGGCVGGGGRVRHGTAFGIGMTEDDVCRDMGVCADEGKSEGICGGYGGVWQRECVWYGEVWQGDVCACGISLGDVHKLPTLCIAALFGVFNKFCFDVQTCHHISTACKPGVFRIALCKGVPKNPHLPPPTGHSVGAKEATRAATQQNAQRWQIHQHPREIYAWIWVHALPVRIRLATSVCQLRHYPMQQGPTEPHAGRSTFLLSSGGAGGGYYCLPLPPTHPMSTQPVLVRVWDMCVGPQGQVANSRPWSHSWDHREGGQCALSRHGQHRMKRKGLALSALRRPNARGRGRAGAPAGSSARRRTCWPPPAPGPGP